MIRTIHSDAAPPANGHYSQAVAANGFLFLSGQLPIVPGAEPRIPDGIEAQAEQVLANIAAILEAAGSGVDRLVSVTVFVTDIAFWPAVDRVYSARLGNHRPARAVLVSPQLHLGASVVMQAIALAA